MKIVVNMPLSESAEKQLLRCTTSCLLNPPSLQIWGKHAETVAVHLTRDTGVANGEAVGVAFDERIAISCILLMFYCQDSRESSVMNG